MHVWVRHVYRWRASVWCAFVCDPRCGYNQSHLHHEHGDCIKRMRLRDTHLKDSIPLCVLAEERGELYASEVCNQADRPSRHESTGWRACCFEIGRVRLGEIGHFMAVIRVGARTAALAIDLQGDLASRVSEPARDLGKREQLAAKAAVEGPAGFVLLGSTGR